MGAMRLENRPHIVLEREGAFLRKGGHGEAGEKQAGGKTRRHSPRGNPLDATALRMRPPGQEAGRPGPFRGVGFPVLLLHGYGLRMVTSVGAVSPAALRAET